MTEALPPQPWMTAPSTRTVIDALETVGGPGSARFVGGCVRDALLRRPIGDIDIATPLTPDAVTKALTDAGLKAIPTGIEHGTVTAVAEHKPFEITTLRRDLETDGRRAVVAFTDDWAEDAARRDFRLNALYLEPDGTLHDPTGGGIEDARAGRIIFVGDAETRIREDYLRILRFFRFHAWFGKGEPDPSGLSACAALKEGVKTLSGERISKELLKLLAAEDPRASVRLMAASGVLSALLPEAQALTRFDTLVEIETAMLFEDDAALRLAALLPDDRGAVLAAAQRLRLSNSMRDRLLAACADGLRLTSFMSPREMRRAIYRLGGATFKDRVKLAWAASDRTATYVQWRMLYTYADAWTPPPFPLDGAEIMAAGVPEGPLIGQVRREVEDWWIDLDFTDDKMAVLERLKAVAQGLAY
jgi:poly(A) polymerase